VEGQIVQRGVPDRMSGRTPGWSIIGSRGSTRKIVGWQR
jgi:hypothetical protein